MPEFLFFIGISGISFPDYGPAFGLQVFLSFYKVQDKNHEMTTLFY
jgi:hypothetical protein